MTKGRGLFPAWCVLALLLAWPVVAAGQEPEEAEEVVPRAYPPPKGVLDVRPGERGKVTLNLKNVSVQDFLGMVAEKTGRRFVIKPEVKDVQMTAYLPDIRLDEGLRVVLAAHELEFTESESGIVLVTKKREEPEPPEEVPPLPKEAFVSEVVKLKFADAHDVKETLEPLLSEQGEIMVVKRSGFPGWTFGARQRGRGGGGRWAGGGTGTEFAPRERTVEGYKKEVRSQLLVISETVEKLELLKSIIEKIDLRPKQVLICATIVEVGRDKLRDIGFDWASGSTGVETSDITITTPWGGDVEFRGNVLGSQVAPGNFQPEADIAGTFPFEAGMSLLFKKIGGTEFELLIHALEELADANVLSSPKLVVLDNQEATFLVGTRFPILETEVTGVEVGQVTTSLDYYENIGIQLLVVPQIQEEKYINMIVHPVVSDQIGTVAARGTGGETLAEYPIIATRETETQIMIGDGQTIVIGGLLKEVKTESTFAVPVLGHIPVMGALFRRKTYDTEKVDLVMFLSASVISEPGEATEEKMRGMDRTDEALASAVLEKSAQLQQEDRCREALELLTALGEKTVLLVSEEMRNRLEQRAEELERLIEEKREAEEQRPVEEKAPPEPEERPEAAPEEVIPPEESARGDFESGLDAFHARQYGRARALLKKASDDPKGLDWQERDALRSILSRIEGKLQELERLFRRGKLLYRLGRLERAREALLEIKAEGISGGDDFDRKVDEHLSEIEKKLEQSKGGGAQ